MITFNFFGTSHGEGYYGEIDGLPQGFTFLVEEVNQQLNERKQGYGRSGRQQYQDKVVFEGFTNKVVVKGTLRFFVANHATNVENRPPITAVRSGHVDLVGQARHPNMDSRQLNEIASARNSVCYVVLGAICQLYLKQRGIYTYHYVHKIGGVTSRNRYRFGVSEKESHFALLHCPCKFATGIMQTKIDQAREQGNTLGGVVYVGATGVPMGLGELLPYTSRLDAKISANMMGIPSVKGISFGIGDKYSTMDGLSTLDKLQVEDNKITYATNNCGGIVGGITTGQDILFSLTVKPIPTVSGAQTIDSVTLQPTIAHVERADTCVVPNVGVIAQNILAYVIVDQLLQQDNL